MEKNIQGRKKTVIVGIVVAVIVVAAVIAIVVKNVSNTKSYRSIKVTEISGEVSISNEDGDVYDATTNMNLVSGDQIATGADSYVIIKADTDKYMRLAENSTMVLTASGNSKNSKTTIELEDGSVLNEIQEHLSDDSTYDVKTPGATMSVRGTVYNVTYDAKTKESSLYVYDGIVNCTDAQGTSDNYEKGEYTQFVVNDDGSVEYIVQKGQITEEMIDPQIKEWLDEIEGEGRNVTYIKKTADANAMEEQEQEQVAVEDKQVETAKKKVVQSQPATNDGQTQVDNNAVVEDSNTNNSDTEDSSNTDDKENENTNDDNNEDDSSDVGDLYLHMANPILVAETGNEERPLNCTVTETGCVLGNTTITAPVEYWGYNKTYVKGSMIAPPYNTTPTVNMGGFFEETPQFYKWENIGNTELAKTNEFILNQSDTYYAKWIVDGTYYYPVEIHFGTKTYVFSIEDGTFLNINGKKEVAIYTNTSITVE